MVKLLSTVLSFLLIFGSVVPSLAQVQQSTIKTKELKSQIYSVADQVRSDQTRSTVLPTLREIERKQAAYNAKEWGLLNKISALVAEWKTSTDENDGDLSFDKFEEEYRKINAYLLEEAKKQAKTPEEAQAMEKRYEELITETVVPAYNQYQKNYNQLVQSYKQELKKLSDEAVEITALVPQRFGNRAEDETESSKSPELVDPISGFLPIVYEAFGNGVVSDSTRKKAVKVLRNRLETLNKGKATEILLQNAHALAVLGFEKLDAELVSKVLIKHANEEEGMSPLFIDILGADLAAMNDVAPDYGPLRAVLIGLQRIEKGPSVWEVQPILFSTWAKAIHSLSDGIEFATRNYIYSIYKDPNATCGEDENGRHCDNYRSAWIDLGSELGKLAQEDSAMKRMLNDVINELVHVQWTMDGKLELHTSNNLFLTGLLGSKFEIKLEGKGPRETFTPQGKVITSLGNDKEVTKVIQDINSLGLTQSEYLAFVLYHYKYEDIEPATARYIRNLLYEAITTPEKAKQLGMQSVDKPTAEEVESYDTWKSWEKTAFWSDIVVLVASLAVGIYRLIPHLSKIGQFGSTFVRAMRLSTVVARSGSGSVSFQTAVRLMKISRAHVFDMGQIRSVALTVENIAKPVVGQAGKNIFTHNGITYFVPKGFRNVLVYIDGRWSVQVVGEGLSSAQIAKQFSVPQMLVREITVENGVATGNALKLLDEMVAPSVAKGLSYTAGAPGVNEGTVSAGVGAGMGRGSIPTVSGLKPVQVPTAAEPATGVSTAATAANQGAQTAKQGQSFFKWLDETVIHWRPINSATPSFARQSWDSLNYWLRIRVPDFLRGVGQLGTSRYGVGTLTSGVAPLYTGSAVTANSTAIVAEASVARGAMEISDVAASAIGAAETSATAATTVPAASRPLFNTLKNALNVGMNTVAPAIVALSPWWAPSNARQNPLQVNIDNAYQQWIRKEDSYVNSQLRARLQQSVAQTTPMAFVVTEGAAEELSEEEPVVTATQGTAAQATADNVTTPITLSQQSNSGIAAMDIIPGLSYLLNKASKKLFPGAHYLINKAIAKRKAAKEPASPDRHKFRDNGLASTGLSYTADVVDEEADRIVPVTFQFETQKAKEAFFKRLDLAEDEYFLFQPGTGYIIIRNG